MARDVRLRCGALGVRRDRSAAAVAPAAPVTLTTSARTAAKFGTAILRTKARQFSDKLSRIFVRIAGCAVQFFRPVAVHRDDANDGACVRVVFVDIDRSPEARFQKLNDVGESTF